MMMSLTVDLESSVEFTLPSGEILGATPLRISISEPFSFTVPADAALTVINSGLPNAPRLKVECPQGMYHLKPATAEQLGWGVILELRAGDEVKLSPLL